jgi:hypothetical protein
MVKAMPMALQVASAHKIPWKVQEKEYYPGSKRLGGASFHVVFEPNDVDKEVVARPAGDFMVHVTQFSSGQNEFDVRAEINFEESGGKAVFSKEMVSADEAVKALKGPVKSALAAYLKKHDFRVQESTEDDGEELDEASRKKKMAPHMWVISKSPTGGFLVTIGDPRKTSSKLKKKFSNVDELKDWVKFTQAVSKDHMFDATGLKLVPSEYSDFYMKMQESDDDGEELDEQMQVVKVQKLRGAQLAQARKQRKKLRAAKKAYAKKYYARNKRKIAKRRKKALAKFGKKGLARLHKQHKRVMVAGIDRLSTLREELAENIETTMPEQVATNAGWLAVLLGEVFESVGEGESAETLFELSDNAADLSERLTAVTEETLEGRNSQELEHLVTTVARALKIYEDIGSPSLWEAVQYEAENCLVESMAHVHQFLPRSEMGTLYSVGDYIGDKKIQKYIRTIIHGIEMKQPVSTEVVAMVLSALPQNSKLKSLKNALKNALHSAQ